MASVALVAAALLTLLTRARQAAPMEARRSVAYWWVLASFGWRSSMYAVDLVWKLPSGNAGILVGFGPMLIIGAVWFFGALRQGGRIDHAGLPLLLLSLISLAYVISGVAELMPLVALVSLLPAIASPPAIDLRAIRAGLVDSMRVVAGLLLILTAAVPAELLGACRLDKCSHFGMQLGSTGDANALGLSLAVTGVLAASCVRGRLLVPYLLAVAVLVDLTSSRSAALPLVLGAAAILAIRVLSVRAGRGCVIGLMLVGLSAQLYVALAEWQPGDFTGRASLWLYARQLIKAHPIVGYGSSFWVRQPRTSVVDANYSVHNALLEVLVSMGAVGCLLLVVAIVVAVRSKNGQSDGMVAIATIVWLAAGVTEVTAAPGRLYILPGSLVLIFLLSRAAVAVAPGGDDGHSALEDHPVAAAALQLTRVATVSTDSRLTGSDSSSRRQARYEAAHAPAHGRSSRVAS